MNDAALTSWENCLVAAVLNGRPEDSRALLSRVDPSAFASTLACRSWCALRSADDLTNPIAALARASITPQDIVALADADRTGQFVAEAERQVIGAFNLRQQRALAQDFADGRIDFASLREGFVKTTAPSPADPERGLWARVMATRVDPSKEPDEPRPVFFIGGKPVVKGGNLAVVASLPGEGKTSLLQGALAAKLAREPIDALGWSGDNADGGLILHLDTEQERHDHWNFIRRAMRRARVNELPPYVESYHLISLTRRERMEFLREWVRRHRNQKIDSILIDGAADLVVDVNDPAESFAIVDELHQIVSTTGAGMVAVIHLNPGQNSKTRGHFGSEMQRKAHSQIELRRDGDEIVVRHTKGRHGRFDDFRFTWCDVEQMHVSLGRYVDPQLAGWRDALFGSDTLVGANEAIRRLETIRGSECSNGTAKNRWRKIVAAQLVTKSAEGVYRKCA